MYCLYQYSDIFQKKLSAVYKAFKIHAVPIKSQRLTLENNGSILKSNKLRFTKQHNSSFIHRLIHVFLKVHTLIIPKRYAESLPYVSLCSFAQQNLLPNQGTLQLHTNQLLTFFLWSNT